MAGAMVSATSSLYAGNFQYIVVTMILAASGSTGLLATLLVRKGAFTAAAQLALRPEPRAAAAR